MRPIHINGPNIWLQWLLPELQLRGVEGKVLFLVARKPASCQTVQAL